MVKNTKKLIKAQGLRTNKIQDNVTQRQIFEDQVAGQPRENIQNNLEELPALSLDQAKQSIKAIQRVNQQSPEQWRISQAQISENQSIIDQRENFINISSSLFNESDPINKFGCPNPRTLFKAKGKQIQSQRKEKEKWTWEDQQIMLKHILQQYLVLKKSINWHRVAKNCKMGHTESAKYHYQKIIQKIRKGVQKEMETMKKAVAQIEQLKKEVEKFGKQVLGKWRLNKIEKQNEYKQAISEWDGNVQDKQIVEACLKHKTSNALDWMKTSTRMHHQGRRTIKRKSLQQNENSAIKSLFKTEILNRKNIPPSRYEQKSRRLYILKNIQFSDKEPNSEGKCFKRAPNIAPKEMLESFSFKQKIEKGLIDFTNQIEMEAEIMKQIGKFQKQREAKISKMKEIEKKIKFLKGGFDCQLKINNYIDKKQQEK